MVKRAAAARTLCFVVLMTVVVAGSGEASIGGTDVFLPSVGSAPGQPPSIWYATAWVFNPNSAAVTVTFSLLLRNQENTSPSTYTVSVGTGAVMQIDDAVATMFGVQGFGAIRVQADAEVYAAARIYS